MRLAECCHTTSSACCPSGSRSTIRELRFELWRAPDILRKDLRVRCVRFRCVTCAQAEGRRARARGRRKRCEGRSRCKRKLRNGRFGRFRMEANFARQGYWNLVFGSKLEMCTKTLTILNYINTFRHGNGGDGFLAGRFALDAK